jgi:hypothetical protein
MINHLGILRPAGTETSYEPLASPHPDTQGTGEPDAEGKEFQSCREREAGQNPRALACLFVRRQGLEPRTR